LETARGYDGKYVWRSLNACLENDRLQGNIRETTVKQNPTSRRLTRGNPFLTEQIHDPYRAGEKSRSATRCPECGVQYRNGRWIWPKSESSALRQQVCPACRRIAEHYPAGEIILAGSFLTKHRKDILATVRHIEDKERSQHPLNRIMAIEERDGSTVITTTDLHLPRRIAHALHNAWGGTTKTHYDLGGYFTRVHWERDS
jgi:hypothetical protein